MIEKSAQPTGFHRPINPSPGPADSPRETFDSLPTTAGPWSPDAQHGGPPAALLARAVERLPEVARSAQALLVGPRQARSVSR